MGEERRYKLLWVSTELLMYMRFGACLRRGDEVLYPVLENWPEGAVVRSVTYDHLTDSFAFRLYHPDWPVIASGEHIPPLRLNVRSEMLKVVPPQERRGPEFL